MTSSERSYRLSLAWALLVIALASLIMIGCAERARSADGEVSGLKAARIARPFGTMVYRYFAPPAAKPVAPLPLVVYLHSNGRQGMDNKKQVDFRVSRWVEAQASHPCYVLAPQLPDGFWVDVDFSKGRYDAAHTPATPAMRLVIELIAEVMQQWSVDRRRVYVVGTSIGGYGVWDLITRKPAWFAAAVPIEGGGDPGRAADIAHVAIWAFHGARDRTVPVAASRSMVEALRAAGGHPRYTEYPEVDHDSPKRVFAPETGLDAWLFAQRSPDKHE